ncbi:MULTISPECIES: RidA family protein [Bradyrhizobium]|uniref:RidA family protein n=1 Tax=Bradyrhizobium elkanii TaxID=29448 RepID=A0A4U6RI57_BRAEL|nr:MULTISPECIES: RidA family protein [Bradyrhizobium]MTV11829.1 RidA family protein [Bradyrhizobium sp. BR2003]TKV73660.1 RidA family protein [Bradyrhizobium elkanii]
MTSETVRLVDSHAHDRPFSHASIVGPWIFTKGTAGYNPVTGEFPPDIREQTAQCMKNLAEILRECGATFADVVKVNVYLVDVGDYDAVNEIYLKAMEGHKPARCCVGVPALPSPNENMKIEMIAYKEGRSEK